MSLSAATDKVKELAGTADRIDGTIKFVFDEGAIFMDGTGTENVVTNDEKDADCTVSMNLDDFSNMLSGDLNPMNAFMGGMMQVDGDMSIAMKLTSLFA